MDTVHVVGSVSMSDAALLQWLATRAQRPNVLVECGPAAVGPVLRHLMRSSMLPHRHCRLPGALELPEDGTGTLLLENVAALTAAQQQALFDWLNRTQGQVQVVSVTTRSLAQAVENGRFLEALFYRLNVVRIDAPGMRVATASEMPAGLPRVMLRGVALRPTVAARAV